MDIYADHQTLTKAEDDVRAFFHFKWEARLHALYRPRDNAKSGHQYQARKVTDIKQIQTPQAGENNYHKLCSSFRLFLRLFFLVVPGAPRP